MNIIFLDFDGVINSKSYWKHFEGKVLLDKPFDFINVEWLNLIIFRTEAKIVISSDWRKFGFSLDQLRDKLKDAGLQGEVIGQTPIIQDVPLRGMEIQKWLLDNEEWEKFIILDDRDDMGYIRDHLVKTDMETGLTKAKANEAIELFVTQSKRSKK